MWERAWWFGTGCRTEVGGQVLGVIKRLVALWYWVSDRCWWFDTRCRKEVDDFKLDFGLENECLKEVGGWKVSVGKRSLV